MRAKRTGPLELRACFLAVCLWSLVFALPHFYWAAGGRAGLGDSALAADEAFEQSWFFAYNLLAGLLAILAVPMALALVREPGRQGTVARMLRLAAWAACIALLTRGAVGIADVAVRLATGSLDSPALLLLIEPWFIIGGVVFGGLAYSSRLPPVAD